MSNQPTKINELPQIRLTLSGALPYRHCPAMLGFPDLRQWISGSPMHQLTEESRGFDSTLLDPPVDQSQAGTAVYCLARVEGGEGRGEAVADDDVKRVFIFRNIAPERLPLHRRSMGRGSVIRSQQGSGEHDKRNRNIPVRIGSVPFRQALDRSIAVWQSRSRPGLRQQRHHRGHHHPVVAILGTMFVRRTT